MFIVISESCNQNHFVYIYIFEKPYDIYGFNVEVAYFKSRQGRKPYKMQKIRPGQKRALTILKMLQQM